VHTWRESPPSLALDVDSRRDALSCVLPIRATGCGVARGLLSQDNTRQKASSHLSLGPRATESSSAFLYATFLRTPNVAATCLATPRGFDACEYPLISVSEHETERRHP